MITLSFAFKTLSSLEGVLQKLDSKPAENLSLYFPLTRKSKPGAKVPAPAEQDERMDFSQQQ